jgi:hypothetical protein
MLEGKRPLEGQWFVWEDNIKIDIGEIMWESLDWIHVAHGD